LGFNELRTHVGTGEHFITIDAWPLFEAMSHPQWGAGVVQLMVLAYDAAHGGQRHECLCCSRPWTETRAPFLFVAINFLKADRALGCGVCGECALSDYKDRIIAVAERDFGADRASVRHIEAPGHA
jgi:hypothetical protein